MPVNVYEGMYILDTNRYARDSATVSGQIPEMIEKLGGQMLASRLWEERRLAYPIDGHRKGTYWLTYFKLDSDQLVALNRQCKLSDSILRTLFLKVDPRIVEALVSHATQGNTTEAKPAAQAKPVAAQAKPAAAEAKPVAAEATPVAAKQSESGGESSDN